MSQSYGRQLATDARLLRRTCESLIGICSGLIADGELNDREILYLSTWLAENSTVSKTWPAEVIFSRVREILADGQVSKDEREYLLKTLEELVGGSFSDTGAVASTPSTLPLNSEVTVAFDGKSLCFTGQFLFGTRSACERASISRGATCIATVTKKLDYLVIGDIASRDWKTSTHGTKIESAVHWRGNGGRVRIVSEAQWTAALLQERLGSHASGDAP